MANKDLIFTESDSTKVKFFKYKEGHFGFYVYKSHARKEV